MRWLSLTLLCLSLAACGDTSSSGSLARTDGTLTLSPARVATSISGPSALLPKPNLPLASVLARPQACSRSALWISPSTLLGCPSLPAAPTGSWTARHVYGATAPATLARVCAYDWTPSVAGAQPDLPFLQGALANYTPRLPELDCPIVSTLGGGAERERARVSVLRDTFHAQAGRAVHQPAMKPRVRVAVIDSAAHAYEDLEHADYAGHGRLVGRVIEDLTCTKPGVSCATELVNELALPYQKLEERNDREGGVIGKREDLGLAIQRALLGFARDVQAERTEAQRLILNLSVGWDARELLSDMSLDPAQFTPATFQVHAVLARAACLGALVVAAAGNAHDASDALPVLPGAWERMPTPLAKECKDLVGFPEDKAFATLGTKTSVGGKQPLVHAASAVDERDNLLATTPAEGRARFVAYGLSVVTSDQGARGEHTAVLTGSSFAAAVTTGALAGAWAYVPELSPQELVAHVYAASIPVGELARERGYASLCFEGHCDGLRRVSACEAMRAGCELAGCSEPPQCATVGAGEGLPAFHSELFGPEDGPTFTAIPSLESEGPSALVDPWCHGQPGGRDGCPNCGARLLSRQVVIELGPEAQATTARMTIETAEGTFAVPAEASRVEGGFTVALPPSEEASEGRDITPERVVLVRHLRSGEAQLAEDLPVLTEE